MNERRTIATQGAEISADFTTFPVDQRCAEFLAAAGADPDSWTAADPDPDATYADVRTVDLSRLEPYVARPGTVSENAVPISEIEQRPLDQCFIGSCANGQLEDLRLAAEILDGHTVADGVRLIVTPASQAVYRDALRLGYLEKIADAGAVVTNSTCGACFGYHMGVLAEGEVCLTASTRNFRGRMGSPDAEIYMASTATVAASALAGHPVDPREVLA
jgi:3-isopropylmalate/(R)-2-methylmalate dehydratase large subunit